MILKIKALNEQQTIEQMYEYITNKINQNLVLSFNEQEFYFEATKKEFKQKIILLPQMKDFAFIIFFNIYLTDVNTKIYEMSLSHSNGMLIREVYGIGLNQNEILEVLREFSKNFKTEVLDYKEVYKNNKVLKEVIKREYKAVIKMIDEENHNNEVKYFNAVLRAKRIYLHFENIIIDNIKIVLDNIEYDLNLDFYVHIAFRHYYHTLQETDRYFGKDHFKEIKPEEWEGIIFLLCDKVNNQNLSIEKTSKIDFVLKNVFYRITFNKKKKCFASFFPLKDSEISGLEMNTVIKVD